MIATAIVGIILFVYVFLLGLCCVSGDARKRSDRILRGMKQ